MRDNFTHSLKDILARRVAQRCSNPDCRHTTSGPAQVSEKAVSIGVAAHITAAAPGGPRFDESLGADERRSIDNAIWLCQNCAKLIDSDDPRFTVAVLTEWKRIAESVAREELTTRRVNTDVDGAVAELVSLVDSRAVAIRRQMDANTRKAVAAFRREQVQDPKASGSIAQLALALRPRSWRALFGSRWRYDSEDDLIRVLSELREEFIALQQEHRAALLNGEYSNAHDIAGRIQLVVSRHHATCNPDFPDPFAGMIQYCRRGPTIGEICRELLASHKRYPGRISPTLARRLPKRLAFFYAISFRPYRNRKVAERWDKRSWKWKFHLRKKTTILTAGRLKTPQHLTNR